VPSGAAQYLSTETVGLSDEGFGKDDYSSFL